MKRSKQLDIQHNTLSLYNHRWSHLLMLLGLGFISVIAVGFSWHLHAKEPVFFNLFGGFFALIAVAMVFSIPKYAYRAFRKYPNDFVSFRTDNAGIHYRANDALLLHSYPWTVIDELIFSQKTTAEDNDGKWTRKNALVIFLKPNSLDIPEGFLKQTSFFQKRGIGQCHHYQYNEKKNDDNHGERRYYLHQQLPKGSMPEIQQLLESRVKEHQYQIPIRTVDNLDLN